jgi:hypothetical protein
MSILLIKLDTHPGFGEFFSNETVQSALAIITTVGKSSEYKASSGIMTANEIEQKLAKPGNALQIICGDKSWIMVHTEFDLLAMSLMK